MGIGFYDGIALDPESAYNSLMPGSCNASELVQWPHVNSCGSNIFKLDGPHMCYNMAKFQWVVYNQYTYGTFIITLGYDAPPGTPCCRARG